MMLTDLHTALSKYGNQVTTEPGWQTRSNGNQMSSVKTITAHHTAGGNDASDLRVVRDGRAGLRGPLAQILLRKNGIPHIVAAGQATHAGTSRLDQYRNPYAIGIEAVHNGTGAWTDAQYQGFAKTCALLALHYNVPLARVLGHKETCSPPGRKVDPNFDMGAFRQRVKHYMEAFKSGSSGGSSGGPGGSTGGSTKPKPTYPGIGGGSNNNTNTQKESPLMALSSEDKKDLYNAVWFGTEGAPLIPNPSTGGGEWPYTALANLQGRILKESGLIDVMNRQLDLMETMTKTLDSISNRMVRIEQIVSDPN